MTNKELAVFTALIAVVCTIAIVHAIKGREVNIYMDPENNVVCYYTTRAMQCFLYTDEGTHLELKP